MLSPVPLLSVSSCLPGTPLARDSAQLILLMQLVSQSWKGRNLSGENTGSSIALCLIYGSVLLTLVISHLSRHLLLP